MSFEYLMMGSVCFIGASFVGFTFGLPVGPIILVSIIGFAGGIFAHFWKTENKIFEKARKRVNSLPKRID